MAWTAPKTWSVGEVVTASNMNAHVRDNLSIVGSASKPSARVTHNATQNVSTGVSNQRSLDFNTETWDYAGLHVTGSSSHRLKAPTGGDGVYLIGGNVTWALAGGIGQDKQLTCGIEFNSSDGAGTFVNRAGDLTGTVTASARMTSVGTYPLTAGQFVCFTVGNGTTSTSVISADAAGTPVNFWATWDSA